jgi:hypothetical protein
MKWVVAFAILLITGCDGITQPVPERTGEPIQTDSLVYHARQLSGNGTYSTYGFRLISTFRNTTADTVYLQRCYPDSTGPTFGLPLIDPPGQESAYSGFWACVGHNNHIPVPPFGVRRDTLQISGPFGWTQDGKPLGVFEGNFRLAFRVMTCRQQTQACVAPAESGLSNSFQIRLK